MTENMKQELVELEGRQFALRHVEDLLRQEADRAKKDADQLQMRVNKLRRLIKEQDAG